MSASAWTARRGRRTWHVCRCAGTGRSRSDQPRQRVPVCIGKVRSRSRAGIPAADQFSADSSTMTPPSKRSSAEKPRRLSAVLSSVSVSTPFSFRDIARVRLPRVSTELLAALSCRASELTTSPYLSNSPFIAPRSCQTSLDRFCKAKDRNPIWNDVSNAAKFVGPAMMTRQSRCSCSDRPGWRRISARRLSVGTNRIANSRVCGGIDVLTADLLCARLDLSLKLASEMTDQFGIASRGGLLQMLVVFAREFRVDWQGIASIAFTTRLLARRTNR